MSVFDETPSEAPNRTPIIAGVLVVLLLIAAGLWFLTRAPEKTPTAASAPTATPAPAAPPRTVEATPAPAPTEGGRRPAPKKPAEAPPAAEPAAPKADAVTLTVESDVPGASVFVDREFVGTAPVTLKDLAPGTKRINLSAEGFEGVQRSVDVVSGDNTVTMRFKEVRLNATVGVAHKHGMGGGCQGTLRATIDGLTYETTNKSDAFTLKYDQVEAFDVNYLEKNLRVKQRGGKTWNFTDRAAENADKLFVFQRDVQAARDKLAKGYSAAR